MFFLSFVVKKKESWKIRILLGFECFNVLFIKMMFKNFRLGNLALNFFFRPKHYLAERLLWSLLLCLSHLCVVLDLFATYWKQAFKPYMHSQADCKTTKSITWGSMNWLQKCLFLLTHTLLLVGFSISSDPFLSASTRSSARRSSRCRPSGPSCSSVCRSSRRS